jgi:protein tyrosine phosphatase
MVTNLVEKGSQKADQYWPTYSVDSTNEKENDQEKCVFGAWTVKIIGIVNHEFFVQRIFELSIELLIDNETQIETRIIHQLHYLLWPDFGAPENPMEIIKLLQFADTIREISISNNLTGPLLVHCSAGIGRSGTLIAIHHLMEKVRLKEKYCVPQTVSEMRNYRNGMVQTIEQYKFIYDALGCYAKCLENI